MKNTHYQVVVERYHQPEEYFVRKDLLEVEAVKNGLYRIVNINDPNVYKKLKKDAAINGIDISDIMVFDLITESYQSKKRLVKYSRTGEIIFELN